MTVEHFTTLLEAHLNRQPFHDGVAVFVAPGGVPAWFDHESVSQFIDGSANTTLDDRANVKSA